MKKTFVYPASFSPPTYGHLGTVRKAAETLPSLNLVCSINPEKDNWFSEEERAAMWSSYVLPENVCVKTFSGMSSDPKVDLKNIAMVRGIRDEKDYDYEKKVAFMNRDRFGIDSFLYFMADPKTAHISSTLARRRAEEIDLRGLAECVSPLVVSTLLEKVLGFNRIFLVVGRPGGGKSTFCQMLNEIDSKNYHINTDLFMNNLKSLVREKFGDVDPISLVIDREEELKDLIARPWFELLKKSLRKAPKGNNVFLEIPYAFQHDKELWRNVGGRAIYVGSGNEEENLKRVMERGTPQIVLMIERIPDFEETQKIAVKNRLQLDFVDSDCSLAALRKKAKAFNDAVQKKEGTKWMIPSFASF